MVRLVVGAVLLLLVSACAGTDGSQVAAGGDATPIVTTPPLGIPEPLFTPQSDPVALPTTAPVDAEPTELGAAAAAPTDEPAEPAATAAATAEPTAVPSTPTAEAQSSATTTPPAPTAAADPTATPAQSAGAVSPTTAPAPTSPPAPVAQGGGQSIPLGDFEVVNLITGANQNIAELSPSGPTMLWFWAPH